MFSTINHIDSHMRSTVELAKQCKQYKSQESPPWQMVQPMVGKTMEVTFTDDERMLAVADIQKDFIVVLEMPDIHNFLVDLVGEYSKRRIELASLMPAVTQDGMLATTELTTEEFQRLTPRMLNLQSLVVPMIEQSAKARADAIKVFGLIKADGMRRFGAAFPKLELDISLHEGGH